MRDKRLEENKQKEMNSKEYKEYMTSKKEDRQATKQQKILYNQKIKEVKQLQTKLKSEGDMFGDKEGITKFIDKVVERKS